MNVSGWIRGATAVFLKDVRLEMRTRYAVNMLLLFVLSALLLMAFAAGRTELDARLQTGLLWIVIIFSAAIGLGRSFVAEEERGTVLLLQLNVPGGQVFAGKLAFNFVLLLGVDIAAAGLFGVFLELEVVDAGLLAASLAVGSLGLAGATTLLAAIIARASNRGPLLPVLLFPLLVPLLLSVVSAGRAALDGGDGWAAATGDLVTLTGFAGVVITTAFLLFDYVWND